MNLIRITPGEYIVYSQYRYTSTEIQQQQQQSSNKKEIYVSFTFETGPMLDFKQELHRLWKQCYIYDGSPLNNVTLKISTRRNKSLSQLLIRKKPPKSMLSDIDSTNTN